MSGTAEKPATTREHVREFFCRDLTPLAIYHRLSEGSDYRFLLESVTGGDQVSRYSFVGASPAAVYRLFRDRLEIETPDGRRRVIDERPLAALAAEVARIRSPSPTLPFGGGFVGYFGYDLARLSEPLGPPPCDDPYGLPLAELGRYDTVVVFDHARQRLAAVSNEVDGLVSSATARRRLDELTDSLLEVREIRGAAEVPPRSDPTVPEMEAVVSADDYTAAVERLKEHIRAGDILQAVLARRWTVEAALEPESLYRAVRLINPSPYMVLLDSPAVALIGASPEMLVRKQGARLETRPIAGTRRRGRDPSEDRALAEELLGDAKERAEHVMLVDLGRNDLGRVARPGTVKVASFMEVERYSHVMHLVSSVEAEAPSELAALEAMLATFPAGTVSGAPKVRAMQLIDDYEREARGPYAGAVGYLSYGGDIDTCITIRTLVVQNGRVSVTAGAGIVADSVPEREARETEEKAAALLAAVELARALD